MKFKRKCLQKGVKYVKYLLLIKIKEYLRRLKPLIAFNHLLNPV